MCEFLKCKCAELSTESPFLYDQCVCFWNVSCSHQYTENLCTMVHPFPFLVKKILMDVPETVSILEYKYNLI